MEQLLPGLAQYGIAGAALGLVALILYVVVTKSIPALTATWSEQMAAERAARAAEAEADRQMFRELFAGLSGRLDRIEIKIDQLTPKRI